MQSGAYSEPVPTKQRRQPELRRTKTPGIYKRGRRYYVVFRDAAGSQRKKSLATLADARAFKAQVAAAVYRGEYLSGPDVAFAEYARRWINGYGGRTSRGLRARTRRAYLLALGLDKDGKETGGGAISYFGRRSLASVRPPDVRDYGEWLAEQGLARNTIRVTLAPLKAMFACAYEDGIIRTNPTARLRMGPKALAAPRKDARAFSEAELRRVLEEIPSPYGLVIKTLADTGIRVSELLALCRSDIDLERRVLCITKSLVDGDYGTPKSTNSSRFVSFSPALATLLSERLSDMGERRSRLRPRGRAPLHAFEALPRRARRRRTGGHRLACGPPHAEAHVRNDPLPSGCAEGADTNVARP